MPNLRSKAHHEAGYSISITPFNNYKVHRSFDCHVEATTLFIFEWKETEHAIGH